MPIKYGEIYVKHNTENLWNSTVFWTVFWLGYDEQAVSEDSTIIVKFDDGDVQEVSNKSSDEIVKTEFCVNDTYNPPSNFIIKRDDKEHSYFMRNQKEKMENMDCHLKILLQIMNIMMIITTYLLILIVFIIKTNLYMLQ